MSAADQAVARRRLDDERRRLEASVADIGSADPGASEAGDANTPELEDHDERDIDGGTDLYDRSQDLGLEEDMRAQIDEIDAALARVEAGTYGTCEVCGQPIAEERLEALPAARLCAADAQRAADAGPLDPPPRPLA